MMEDKELCCSICGENHETTVCVSLSNTEVVIDTYTLSKARLTLPEGLQVNDMIDGSTTVVSKKEFKAGVRFGPFKAKTSITINPDIEFPLKLFKAEAAWNEKENNFDMTDVYLESNDEDTCNWMCLVTYASCVEELNLICFQMNMQLYYLVINDVNVGDELKVWYAPHYANLMISALPKTVLEQLKHKSLCSDFNIKELICSYNNKIHLSNNDNNLNVEIESKYDFDQDIGHQFNDDNCKLKEISNTVNNKYVPNNLKEVNKSSSNLINDHKIRKVRSNRTVRRRQHTIQPNVNVAPQTVQLLLVNPNGQSNGVSDEVLLVILVGDDAKKQQQPSATLSPSVPFALTPFLYGAKQLKREWKCRKCNYIDQDVQLFAKHLMSHAKEDENKIGNDNKGDENNRNTDTLISDEMSLLQYHCGFCNICFKDNQELKNHYKICPQNENGITEVIIDSEKNFNKNEVDVTASPDNIVNNITLPDHERTHTINKESVIPSDKNLIASEQYGTYRERSLNERIIEKPLTVLPDIEIISSCGEIHTSQEDILVNIKSDGVHCKLNNNNNDKIIVSVNECDNSLTESYGKNCIDTKKNISNSCNNERFIRINKSDITVNNNDECAKLTNVNDKQTLVASDVQSTSDIGCEIDAITSNHKETHMDTDSNNFELFNFEDTFTNMNDYNNYCDNNFIVGFNTDIKDSRTNNDDLDKNNISNNRNGWFCINSNGSTEKIEINGSNTYTSDFPTNIIQSTYQNVSAELNVNCQQKDNNVNIDNKDITSSMSNTSNVPGQSSGLSTSVLNDTTGVPPILDLTDGDIVFSNIKSYAVCSSNSSSPNKNSKPLFSNKKNENDNSLLINQDNIDNFRSQEDNAEVFQQMLIEQIDLLEFDNQNNNQNFNDKEFITTIMNDVVLDVEKNLLVDNILKENGNVGSSINDNFPISNVLEGGSCTNNVVNNENEVSSNVSNKTCVEETQNDKVIKLKKQKEKNVQCDICEKWFSQSKYLVRHLKKHTGEFKCLSCFTVFARNETLMRHKCTSSRYISMRKIFKKKQLLCVICGDCFKNKEELKKHQFEQNHFTLSDHDGNNDEVEFDTPFISEKNVTLLLPNGEAKKLGEKNYLCELCGYVNKTRTAYRIHYKTNHCGFEYTCDTCDKKFSRKSVLTEHLKTHKPPSNECPICNKKMKSSSALNVHLKTHTGNKPFTCDVCSLSFYQKANLAKHLRTHRVETIGGLKFKCNFCNMTYTKSTTFKDHVRKVHKSDMNHSYMCCYCDKPLPLKHRASFKRHLTRQHFKFKHEWEDEHFIDKMYKSDDSIYDSMVAVADKSDVIPSITTTTPTTISTTSTDPATACSSTILSRREMQKILLGGHLLGDDIILTPIEGNNSEQLTSKEDVDISVGTDMYKFIV